MPKPKNKGAGSKASSSQWVPAPECEVYAARVWTVTQAGGLLLPVASPLPERMRAWARSGRWLIVATMVDPLQTRYAIVLHY